MTEIPKGISLNEVDGGYVLHRKDEDGVVVSMPISEKELLALKEAISSWNLRETLPAPPGAKSVQEIVCYPVERVGLAHEALGERLLLTLATSPEARRTYALAPHQVSALIENLPLYLAEMRGPRPTKQ